MKIILSILLFAGLFFYSCVSEKPAEPVQAEPVVQEPVAPAVQEESKPEAEPAPEPEPEAAAEEDHYQVSEELYQQTFDEIEALIKELNQVISKKQYDRWLKYLSSGYIRKYNSQEVLDAINEYPQLKDNGIVLKNLRDYFDWVVVPSRSRAVLGEIIFVGETKVVAYSSFEGTRAKLYQLEKNDNNWKITVWE
ncbi:MAG: hypothetical protein DRP70_06185 [Spirochaetes bacterium]|nr:MAG: hypothetical protein DRP60_16855 [Spirochaetota bacterium]RKX88649.1 MAG: hypothetical protein DRP70_06185 [Spirochaetota bacterium]RKX95780.1 MAG: hypothetical protein DRZ90_09750 [Spirochaetota bacterium]